MPISASSREAYSGGPQANWNNGMATWEAACTAHASGRASEDPAGVGTGPHIVAEEGLEEGLPTATRNDGRHCAASAEESAVEAEKSRVAASGVKENPLLLGGEVAGL
jgi:hypothetical protein